MTLADRNTPRINNYRGRFAPSPTGPLHLGSLFAAVISYLEAHKNHGKWLVRIENIDPLREQANSIQSILNTLVEHGLMWDEDLIFQSDNSALYEKTLKQLAANNLTYECPCSRKDLNKNQGTHTIACQQQTFEDKPFAIKFKSPIGSYPWHDLIQGDLIQILDDDFILKRKEEFYAYQLAVVCDDIDQGITHVVRGSDLLSSTPMQLALYRALNVAPPTFAHFPVIIDPNGNKLSKQNFASPIDDKHALENLLVIFEWLKIKLPVAPVTPKEALTLALSKWNINIIPNKNILNHTKHFISDAFTP